MNVHQIETVSAAIAYIEDHLDAKLKLETVARSLGYSSYHLHHLFTDTVGITMHNYIQRRQLSEAAKQLVFSQKPIIEISLSAGYKSQQAFTGAFKAMYKQTPLAYRQRETFYPLQQRFSLNLSVPDPDSFSQTISYATAADLPAWMNFVQLVIDGFPCLDEGSHRRQIRQYIERQEALIIRDGLLIVGAAAFSSANGSVDFLAIHPQYRHYGVAKTLLDFLMTSRLRGTPISITTFREGDKADPGQRKAYRKLGFTESQLLEEFGYPTQRLILKPESRNHE